jgi:hypothetical protein
MLCKIWDFHGRVQYEECRLRGYDDVWLLSNRRFVETFRLNHQAKKDQRNVSLRTVLQSPVTANDVPSWLILFTPIMEAIRSSETSALTRATCHIPEDCILHSPCRENLKPYMNYSCLLRSQWNDSSGGKYMRRLTPIFADGVSRGL